MLTETLTEDLAIVRIIFARLIMDGSSEKKEIRLLSRRVFFKSASGFALAFFSRVSLAQAFYVGFWKKRVVVTSSTLWAWGDNQSYGQLGDFSTTIRSSPVQIGSATTWSKVVGGKSFAAAIKNNGSLWTWGIGTSGVLADGTTTSKSSPIQIGTLTDWDQISLGNTHGLALKTDGTPLALP